MARPLLGLALGTVLGLAPVAAGAAAGRITVAERATVAGALVTLGDLASLEGEARAYAALELGRAPDPGGVRRLDGHTILRRLDQAGLDRETTTYVIPATIRVQRAWQEVGGAELRALASERVRARLAPGETIDTVTVAGPVRIPLGAFEPRLAGARGGRGVRRRYELQLVQGSDVVASAPVRVTIGTIGSIVTVRRPLRRGDVLREEDLATSEQDLTQVPPGVLRDPGDAVGKQVRTALGAGEPLLIRHLDDPALVRRGDVVTLVVETAAVRVSVPGEALESAPAGGSVRVRNRASERELSGTVVERGVVHVRY